MFLDTFVPAAFAAIGGAAAGAGLSLALACDLRVAVDKAVMTTAFARVGLAGDYGGTWFLTQLVGPAKAKELYFMPERMDMATALDLGIVNKIADAPPFADIRAGAEAGGGTDDRALPHGAALKMRIGADSSAVLDRAAGCEDDMRFNNHIASKFRVVAEEYGLWRSQRRTVRYRGKASALLKGSFGGGKVSA